jgi:hypothetical protein
VRLGSAGDTALIPGAQEDRRVIGCCLFRFTGNQHWRLDNIAKRTGRQTARISEMETGKANSTIDMIADAGQTLGMSLVFVPNDRLGKVLQIIGEPEPPAAQAGEIKSVFETAFVDDGLEDDEEANPHAGPR